MRGSACDCIGLPVLNAILLKCLKRRALLVGAGWLLLGHGAWVGADIRETKHNLATGNADPSVMDRARAERAVCVFCHTPSADESAQNADGGASIFLPKWQRSLEATFTFGLFDDIGRGGSDSTTNGAVGSVSMACLSCHDGIQAFAVTQGASSDHPFGVPYQGLVGGGAAASGYRDRLLTAQDAGTRISGPFDEPEYRPARSSMVNRRQIWWAPVTANTQQRSKSDLPLYPRRVIEGAGDYVQVPFVECTSCHDPHSTREVFLRTSNEGS